ncbi:MAG TPA: nicotinate-nucleotide adenylyltransferase [Candidatus Limnocylindrales bacterium]|nr:nicotinate-nucleotide adenylyltransferase [Candidatus Limnocylindrales bacterium]
MTHRHEGPDPLSGATGILGGTFDPIHMAHLAVAEAARDEFGLRRVLFIPAAQPPHKPGREIAPVEDRFAMVEAAVADNPAFEVSRLEIEREGPSYTVDTLTALCEADPADHLALILSAESYAEFATWREPRRILDLADLIVAPRDGYADADPGLIALHFPDAPAISAFMDGPRIRLSASEIRQRAADGRSVRYLVPDAVAAYIGDHGLYQHHRRDHRT